MDSTTKIPNTRTEQLSRFSSSDELSNKVKAVLGENYKQYSTADKLKILRIFCKPPSLESASGGQLDKVSEISARYNRIERNAEPLALKASEIIKASLPSYVQPMLLHMRLESFESALPRVTRNAQYAARHFAGYSMKTKLMLYGFSLCRGYVDQLNEMGGLAKLYEGLKRDGGGTESLELGYEYKEAFNRQLRTYLPEEQRRALEELETEPYYEERKQNIMNDIEFTLAMLRVGVLSETSSSTTTANTTTTTTTITTGLVSSQRVIDMQTREAAARILEPVNSLGHSTRLRLYLHYKMNSDISKPDSTFNPFNVFCPVSRIEDKAEIELQKRLKEESGKLDKQANIEALKDAILEGLSCLLPNQFKNALSLIEMSQPNEVSFKKDAEELDWIVTSAGKAGSRASRYFDDEFIAPEIIQVIAFSFDQNPERLNRLTEAKIHKVKDAYSLLRGPGSDIHQWEARSAFIECLFPKLPEKMRIAFSNVLRFVDTKLAEEAMLDLAAEYLKEDSLAFASLKRTDEIIDTRSRPTDAPTTTTTTATTTTITTTPTTTTAETAGAKLN